MFIDRSVLKPLLIVLLTIFGVGCVRGCKSSRPPIHPNPNMDYQKRADPQSESDFFYDGMSMRRPVEGTVARGEKPRNPEFHTGKDAAGNFIAANPLARDSGTFDEAIMARGERGYVIYCQPCHDKRGLGRGIVFQYANVPTASLHDDQRRGYPDGQIFDIITNGAGLMQGYRYPITAEDRWAIVAWVRKMQQDRLASQVAQAR